MKIHIIQNVLQSVLTLINRLCIAICLKFYQSNILVLAITLTTKAWAPKILAHNEKKCPLSHRENGTQKEKQGSLTKEEKRPSM